MVRYLKFSSFDFKFTLASCFYFLFWRGNINIPIGQKIAFIGKTGSGKTTTANQILCLISPLSGRLLIDNKPINKSQINVDMVIQNISSDQKTTDITFTIKRDDLLKTIEILKKNKNIIYKNITHNEKVAKVSIVGAGMVSTPGVTYKMFRGLADEKINILAISTSEIKLSVIIDEKNTLNAVKKLHTIFDLD